MVSIIIDDYFIIVKHLMTISQVFTEGIDLVSFIMFQYFAFEMYILIPLLNPFLIIINIIWSQ